MVDSLWQKKWDYEFFEGVSIQPSKLIDYLYVYTNDDALTLVKNYFFFIFQNQKENNFAIKPNNKIGSKVNLKIKEKTQANS